MYRNPYGRNYSSGSLNKDSYNRVPGFGGTGSSFNVSRPPLYPIGPLLTQPGFAPVNRGFSPSPYLKHNDVKPPSYQQRYLRTEPTNENKLSAKER